MILSGEKKEEYREIKPYWTKRFQSAGLIMGNYHPSEWAKTVKFQNGYGKYAPYFYADVTLIVSYGKREWGAQPGKAYYVLRIHRTFADLP